jgi:hypothetical protein
VDPSSKSGGVAEDEKQKEKRKRRKVRSQRKNIYKDKQEKKPTHWTPGPRDFQGSPLTAETQAKLSLPPSNTKLKSMIDRSTGNWDASAVDDHYASNWDRQERKNDLDSMPLSVEKSEINNKDESVN